MPVSQAGPDRIHSKFQDLQASLKHQLKTIEVLKSDLIQMQRFELQAKLRGAEKDIANALNEIEKLKL